MLLFCRYFTVLSSGSCICMYKRFFSSALQKSFHGRTASSQQSGAYSRMYRKQWRQTAYLMRRVPCRLPRFDTTSRYVDTPPRGCARAWFLLGDFSVGTLRIRMRVPLRFQNPLPVPFLEWRVNHLRVVRAALPRFHDESPPLVALARTCAPCAAGRVLPCRAFRGHVRLSRHPSCQA